MSEELLTELELSVVQRLGDIWNDLCNIVGDGATRDPDMNEAIFHIHALQRFIMAQAAGRAYPNSLRLLGRLPGELEPT